jgi:hypothetical protein
MQERSSRRRFLQTVGAASLAGPGAGHASAEQALGPSVPVVGDYDVLVCGAGTSGLPAAVAAARLGMKVGLIERYGFLGGNPAISIMPCWHGLREHHSGLLTEFARMVADFHHGPNPLEEQNHIEPETVKILFQLMAERAGVQLHLHHLIVEPIVEGAAVRGVVTESKSGRRAHRSKLVIDATGDADVSARAGAKCLKGIGGRTQAMTLRFRVGFVDFDRYLDWVDVHSELFPIAAKEITSLKEKARRGEAFYMPGELSKLFDGAGDVDLPTNTYFNCSSIRPGELSINTTRVYDVDGTSADDLTRAELVTRRQAFAVWRFLVQHVPGFEKSVITETAVQVGVRESRCVVGEYVLTEEDCKAQRRFDDSILTCRVSFDSHDKEAYNTFAIRDGLVDVPYRCFLPASTEGLLVVGRILSTDHLTNSAIRRMESAFQTGQVGGTAAALAVRGGVTPRKVPLEELRGELRKTGFKTSQADRSGK